ncbi:hypothetical protein RIR_e28033_A0A2I1FF01_9GLOM [Rhizophagus irregularis DAOM 181602=DAOM 197198]|nr:hypothetical protein RhiirB3_451406 [Rhizophagus irregularis]GET52777.1 hypothetical protein RIR_e28033_A0A2I1FF01_9GLOM [Rhizophagus irregularis DAOM 181602=DAOM 197198]
MGHHSHNKLTTKGILFLFCRYIDLLLTLIIVMANLLLHIKYGSPFKNKKILSKLMNFLL